MSVQDSYRLALERVAAGDVTPMMLFPVGTFRSAKYPELPLTQDLADAVVAHFESGVLGTEPVLDSSGSHDTSAPAAGWVKRVYQSATRDGGSAVFADVQWTDHGADLVSGREYQYNSVELGPVIDNVTGERTDNVLRSVTLTNTPVLRMLPPVLEAGDTIAASEPVEVALSEVTLADIPEFVRAKMRAKWLEAHPDKTEDDVPENMKATDDRDATAASESADSKPVPDAGKGDEGQPLTLADGGAEPKGGPAVDPTILKTLCLSEGASDADVKAAVVTLAEDRDAHKARADAAEATIAAEAKRVRAEAVERTLSDLIEGGHLLPGQRDEMLALAEDSPSGFDRMAAVLQTSRALDLSEHGTSESGGESKPADVELDERSKARAKADGVSIAAAQRLVLSEDPALAKRYAEYRIHPNKEA